MVKRNLLGVVGLAVRLARKCGADVELGERTFAFLEKAVARGMVEQDYSLLYRDFGKIRKFGLETQKRNAVRDQTLRYHRTCT